MIESINNKITDNDNIKDNKISNKNSYDDNEIKNSIFSNLFKENKGGKWDKKEIKRNIVANKGGKKELNFHKEKYAEIDNMQNRLDKASEKLQITNSKYKSIGNDIEQILVKHLKLEKSNRKYFIYFA